MAKRKDDASKKGRPFVGKPVSVRIPDPLMADLEVIAEGMGLDISDVIRVILTENRREYLERLRAKQKPAKDKPQEK